MNVYLASRFSRLPELLAYAAELESIGINVTSRWLRGGHEWVGTPDEDIPVHANAMFAREDLDDVSDASVIVCFTEAPGSGPARGGRHFEAGYAYAMGKKVIVVGHRENVFYCLPLVDFFTDWSLAKNYLSDRAKVSPR